ncbi:CCDC130 [Symbiodinium natans]|uniref:CCDC130 protein n=1 Tax=Symbiodinium natans TaxID=878477 RepID=A0A812KR19_9DINO|nr:CCDC130 [Symbiodinium natans]
MTKDISLKAACADSFYYPQEWKPSRGSLDHFQRKRGFEHHFGKERTKNLSKGVLLIRFEMPFTVQCLRCGLYIRQGTRYNADKKKIGMYFSTPLYEFSMHCGNIVSPEKSANGRAHCNQRLVIRTDPKNDDYELAEGLRRKVEVWDNKDSETLELADPESRRRMDADPMFRVEKTLRDKQKERTDKARLSDLQDLQAEREDAYGWNCVLRKAHRIRRKEEQQREEEERLRGKPNFGVPLEPASEEDLLQAKSVEYKTDHDKIEMSVRPRNIPSQKNTMWFFGPQAQKMTQSLTKGGTPRHTPVQTHSHVALIGSSTSVMRLSVRGSRIVGPAPRHKQKGPGSVTKTGADQVEGPGRSQRGSSGRL